MSDPRILLIYGTGHGQTAKIARRLYRRFDDHGAQTDVFWGKNLSVEATFRGYDVVVVGSSVHMQKHHDYIEEFARAHAPFLNTVPSAFFSVSAARGSDTPRGISEAQGIVDTFQTRTGWDPNMTETFGGSLPYTKYGPVTKNVMKLISRINDGETDTSRDWEYTNWARVDEFADAVLRLPSTRPTLKEEVAE